MSRRKKDAEQTPPHAPQLDEREEQQAEERASAGAHVIHEVIRKQGEDELSRTTGGLAWSGLAAGLSMGFSLVAEGLIEAHLPEARWTPLVSKLGYPVGFLIVIIGRQQLFTENTITPIIPLLARRDLPTFKNVLRLWSVVLAANLVGTLLFALVISHADVFGPEARASFLKLAGKAIEGSFGAIMLKGVFAGWLIALMVWMLGGTVGGGAHIIIIITYVVGVAGLSHIIAGSVEVMYLTWSGGASWGEALGGYVVPTLIGNVLGGISLVAALNHAQVTASGGKRK